MAMDMFLKIDTIEGESADAKHKAEIDLLAWSWGASNSGTFGAGGGGGAGKVQMQDFSFTHYMDKASPKLQLACWNGSHIPKAVLTMRKAGGTQNDYLKYTFTDLLVSSASTGGSGGEDRLTENVTLNFAKIEMEYSEQKKDGTMQAAAKVGWDLTKNVKV